MMGFYSFASAQVTLAGIEIVRMLKKGQVDSDSSPAEIFYGLFA